VLIAHLENNMLSEQAAHHKVKMPNPQNPFGHLVQFFEHQKSPVKLRQQKDSQYHNHQLDPMNWK